MDSNQRPHSRQRTVGSGSVSAGRGRRVDTGRGPVGGGSRPTGSSPQRGYSSGGRRYSGGSGRKFSLRSILVFIVIALIASFVLKSLGGSGFTDISDYDDPTSYDEPSYDNTSSSSYSKPDLTVSPLARDRFFTALGSGRDTVTVMVYMCGTDLESKYGMATKDIQEMLKADIADNVNVIIETGGCNKWQNRTVSNSKNQIYRIIDGGLETVKDNAGKTAMTDPANLTEFIRFCKDNYPADRNILIFWDHGGGSLSGYGYDEKYPSASSMTLPKINSALAAADCRFDFIGFDACLMATFETALVCENYADYLIGSEETEPGTGWYYTNWLSKLSRNTSINTVELSKYIIDDFVSSCCSASPSAEVTLSVVDLAELDGTVPQAFTDFASSTNELITSDDYKRVSDARAGVRQFSAKSKLNQVDLIDLAKRIGTEEAKALANALKGCVKYNKTTISRSNGISVYFPYETTKNVKSAVASYKDLGIDSEYTRCIQSFASLEYGGQIAASASQSSGSLFFPSSDAGDLLGTLISGLSQTSASTSPLDVLFGSFGGSGSSSAGLSIDPMMIAELLGGFSGRSMPGDYDWVDTSLIADKAYDIAGQFVDPSRVTPTRKNGKTVLELTDDEWKLIQTVELNVFAGDAGGYIDLGLDNTFDWADDDLLLEWDGTWLTLNGNVCAYYLVSDTEEADGTWTTVGRIPALLNGELVNLQVVFDTHDPEGTVTGAYPMYDDGQTDVQAKGNIRVVPGDKIELLCDYYDADGNYNASYTLGTTFTVPEEGFTLRNLALENENVRATYRLTDIYGNHFWIAADEY